MRDFRFRIVGNRLRFGGVSFGYGDSDPFLVAHDGKFMVIRKPGAKEWTQLGSSGYYPSRWQIVEFEPDGDRFRIVNVIRTEEPGRFWRRCRGRLIAEMESAARRGHAPRWN